MGGLGRAGRLLFAPALLAVLGCGDPDALAWQDAVAETVVEQGASNPTAAIAGAGGAAYVAWVGTAQGQSDVFLSRRDAAGFIAPVRVNHARGDAAPHAQAPAQVATGPEGAIYVLWQNNTPVEGRRFPASDLRFARSTDGGRTFEPAIYVNDDAGGAPASHTFHDLAVGEDGTIYVSWIDGRRSTGDAAGHGSHGSHGDSGPDIRLARSTDGGRSFEPSTIVDRNSCPCCRTALALAPDGAVYVAWRKVFEGNVRDVVVARSADGGRSFAAPVRVHADEWSIDGCPHAGPALAVDAAGRVHVAWFTGRQGRAGAWYAVSRNGAGSFGAPARLTGPQDAPTTRVALAAEAGTAWIAWEERAAEATVLRLARSRDGAPPERVALDAPTGSLPALAAGNGSVLLAWLEGEAVRALERPARSRLATASVSP